MNLFDRLKFLTEVQRREWLGALGPDELKLLDTLVFKEQIAIQKNIALLERLREWTPRPYQRSLWDYLEGGGKRACVVWHRRSGKDDVALNYTARAAHERVGEYWHMLPEASQGRKAVWAAVNPHTGRRRIDQAFPLQMRARTRDNEMSIEFKNGSLWRVVGSDNYDSLVGSTPAGVVFSEWALADPNAWAFLRPILMENAGWVIFITTPRGNNHAKKTYDLARQDDQWFAEILTAQDTGVFTPDQLASELREYQHNYGREEGTAFFEQEYNCSFEAALRGSYYGPQITRATQQGRITRVPIERAIPVHTAWDLGVSDATAIWFIQVVGRERRLIDYYQGSGVGLEDYVKVLKAKEAEHGFIWGNHYFPHDVQVRELGNKGLSRVDTLKGLGIKATIVPQHNVDDGINAVRQLLEISWIDENRCEMGLDALRSYQRAWNEKMEMFSDHPLHNWASHGADALRTFAAGFRPSKPEPPKSSFGSPFGSNNSGTSWMYRR